MAETCIVRLEIVYFIGTRSQILFEMLFPSVISLDNLYLLDTKQNVFLDIIQIKFPQKKQFSFGIKMLLLNLVQDILCY